MVEEVKIIDNPRAVSATLTPGNNFKMSEIDCEQTDSITDTSPPIQFDLPLNKHDISKLEFMSLGAAEEGPPGTQPLITSDSNRIL